MVLARTARALRYHAAVRGLLPPPFLLAWAAALLAGGQLAAQAPPAPAPEELSTFGEEITVRIATVAVRAVDDRGTPLPGLGPADFRVRVGKAEVPVLAVDWIGTDGGAGDPADAFLAGGEVIGELPAPAAAAPAPAKRVVVFVQADIAAPQVRTKGHLQSLPYVRELLDGLAAADEVAVVSFDSHLKLRLDFTRERTAAADAVLDAIRFGSPAPRARVRGAGSSLARAFDDRAAFEAATPEKALEVTALALRDLPGEKVMVYLGWGLGRYGAGGVRMTPDYAPAVAALDAARTAVFVLDITDASSHSLEIGLQQVAAQSGGTYDRMSTFPAQAAGRLARTLTGHYLLTLDASALPADGALRIALASRRDGRVLARPLQVVTTTTRTGGDG
jgi:hypothetical protein